MNDVDRALTFAEKYHGEQRYGKRPYTYHLRNVVLQAMEFELPNRIVTACALHDILEDTECQYVDIANSFGFDVANIVWDVTHVRTVEYYRYIANLRNKPSARMVKICDLLCNFEESVKSNRTELIKKYSKALFILGAM